MQLPEALSEAITPWLHILAVTVWIGPQFFMFLVTVPALRAIEDSEARVRAMRVIVNRLGWLAWAAMAVIVLSGVSNLFQEGADADFDLGSTDYRYFYIFALKMALVGLAVLLTGVHTFIVGPRQLRLAEEMRAESPEAARLRRASIILSSVSLLASIAVILISVLLANEEFSGHRA